MIRIYIFILERHGPPEQGRVLGKNMVDRNVAFVAKCKHDKKPENKEQRIRIVLEIVPNSYIFILC